jgi:hypothetical protein
MRNRRIKIDEEDQGLSWEEKHSKTRQLLEKDPLWLRLKDRVVIPSQSLSVAFLESREKYAPKQSKGGESERVTHESITARYRATFGEATLSTNRVRRDKAIPRSHLP